MTQIPVSPYVIRLFIQMVREMREAQKVFFNTKSPTSLMYAKRYEVKVDKLMNSIETESEEYGKLKEAMEELIKENLTD